MVTQVCTFINSFEGRRREMSSQLNGLMPVLLPPLNGEEQNPAAGCVSSSILSQVQLDEAYRLRYLFIVKEKGWLPDNGSGVEWDSHDMKAIHFGAFVEDLVSGGKRLVAYARIKPGGFEEMMLAKEFLGIVPNPEELAGSINPSISAEISRLVALPGIAKDVKNDAFKHLYRMMAGWGLLESRVNWYMTVSSKLVAKFERLGFVVEVITRGCFFSGGDECVVARLDLLASQENLCRNFPVDYQFYFGAGCINCNGSNGHGKNNGNSSRGA